MSILNEIKQVLSEVTMVNFRGQKFALKVDVNEDPNKKGIKVQFLPTTFAGISKQQQDDIAMELASKLNQGLAPLGLTVERDRELKDKTIVGFFIYIEYLDKIIINALSQAAKEPETKD
jgi:chaperone required for assembly of F1-ATPase